MKGGKPHRLDQVPQSSRRCHQNIATPVHDSLLLLRTQSSDNTADTDSRGSLLLFILRSVLDKLVQVVDDLQSQLSRWTQDQSRQRTTGGTGQWRSQEV